MAPTDTPFRVEWELAMPIVVPAFPIHLDDLLAWAIVDELEREGDPDAWNAKEDLPLARLQTESDWVWKASRVALEPASETLMVHWVRRTDLAALAADQGTIFLARIDKVNIGSGYLKAYSDFCQVQWVRKAVAFGVGNIDRVRDLLGRISHLGKLRRNGWGRVKSLSVVEDLSAATRWADRVVPVDAPAEQLLAGRTYVSVTHPLRPPYWERRNCSTAIEPLPEA